MFQTTKLFGVVWPFVEGNLKFLYCCEKKKLWGYPTTHFLHVDENMFPSKCIQKWNHLLHVFDFAPITHANVHNILFVYCKMLHDVVLQQIIMPNSKTAYYIHHVHECPC